MRRATSYKEFTVHMMRPFRSPDLSTGLRATLLLAVTAWLAGCAQPQVRTHGEWQAGAPKGQSFSRIVIVGVTPDFNQRCAFERFMGSRIQSASATAIPSCNSLSSKDELTVENIKRVIAANHADAVLVTSLIAAQLGAREGGTDDTSGGTYYKAVGYGYMYDYFWGPYGMPVVYGEFKTSPPITYLQGEAEISTRLYETAGATVVYQVTSTAHDLESRAEGLAVVVPPIADQLRKAGLIR